jgi:type IV secretory pathway TraG/TraD family ATPase VirD4
MPPDEQLILRPGMRPIRAKKIRWFKEREFLRRRMPPPVIPELTVEIPMDDCVAQFVGDDVPSLAVNNLVQIDFDG